VGEIWRNEKSIQSFTGEALGYGRTKTWGDFFPTYIPRILILSKFYTPTDAQLNCLKNNFKIDIKIDIKTVPTCFGVITINRERTIRSWESYFY